MAVVLGYLLLTDRDRGSPEPDLVTFNGYILFQNSDAFVKGAIVRVPADNRQSSPTDEGGFFELHNVAAQTKSLYVQFAGKLHELPVTEPRGHRYKVIPAVTDSQPTLNTEETAAIVRRAEAPRRSRAPAIVSRVAAPAPTPEKVEKVVALLKSGGGVR